MKPTPPTQRSFAQAEYDKKKKRIRRELFLEKMEQVVPWDRLAEVIEPHYPKAGRRGHPPIGLERMLRMYFVQQWYGLADEAVEDAIYDSQALRNFMGIDLSRESVPDATTLMGFRHLLEAHDLPQALLVEVNALLIERGLLMSKGTLVDATLIAAPSATKNRAHARDPEMHQTKKGKQWHFGLKAHIGWRRQGIGAGAYAGDGGGDCLRHQPNAGAAAWSGTGGLGRCRLCGRGQAGGRERGAASKRTRGEMAHRQAAQDDRNDGRGMAEKAGASP
jgi:hypothetical protein